MKLIIYALIFIVLSSCSVNKLTGHYTYGNSELHKKAYSIDSLILVSEKKFSEAKVSVIKGIAEGSTKIHQEIIENDSIVFNGEVGSGGFSNYFYYKEDDNKTPLKIYSNRVVHMNDNFYYEVSERLQINIFFENKEPFLATISENHYNEDENISTNYYELDLTSGEVALTKIYYSNSFQTEIITYIFNIIEAVRKHIN